MHSERYVKFITVGGHQINLERYEQHVLNKDLAGVKGWDSISRVLNSLGFTISEKIKKNTYKIKRADGTEIVNAYLSGNHEKIEVHIKEAFSPSKWLIEQSRSGPGHMYELLVEKD